MPAPVAETEPSTLLALSLPHSVHAKLRYEQARRVLSGRKKIALAALATELLAEIADKLPA